MSIQRFFTKTQVIKRERDTGGDKRAFQTTATVDGHYEDLDAESSRMLGIVGQRAWKFWFDLDEDIQEGDVMVDQETSDEFYVRAVTKKQLGINQHLEVLAVEHNA